MLKTSHEQDFYGWALEQAELLRLQRFEEVDWVNVIEEIADLGRSEYRALVSTLEQLTWHLLKWQYQPDGRSNSWRMSIVNQRLQLERLLDDSPGLKSRLEEAIAKGYKYGRKGASQETELPLPTFPETCPYSWKQIADDSFFP
jgi:ribosome modulation factor